MTTSDDVPDLTANLEGSPQDTQINPNNVRAVQAIYLAAQLEDAQLFQVVDRLVDLFQQGLLPLGPGAGAKLLAESHDLSLSALTESERRSIYTKVLGLPGGDPGDIAPNTAFADLWLQSAYGAHDLYGVLERVTRLGLDRRTTPDIPSAMALAQSGARIINWLASNATKLADPASPPLQASELRAACEQWLAVSGTPDMSSVSNDD